GDSMRRTSVLAAVLLCLPARAADEPARSCTVKLDSTFELAAPAGWRFVECTSAARDEDPAFRLEPAPGAPSGFTMYGGLAGRGPVEWAPAPDREFYSTEFEPQDGDGLRTADRRDVRILHLTHRGEPFTWLAHGYLRAGPTVFWLGFVCEV